MANPTIKSQQASRMRKPKLVLRKSKPSTQYSASRRIQAGRPESRSSSDEEADDEPKYLSGKNRDSNQNYGLLLKSLFLPPETAGEGPENKKKKRKIAHYHEVETVKGSNRSTLEAQPEDGANQTHGLQDPVDEGDVSDHQEPDESHDMEDSDDGEASADDPFDLHFANPNSSYLSQNLVAIKENQWRTETIQNQARITMTTPRPATNTEQPSLRSQTKILSTRDIKLKQKLIEPASRNIPVFSDVQKELGSAIFNYQDVLFGSRTPANADSIRKITSLHILNHLFKTRDRILKNNARIVQNPELEARDQGFTRPKILLLVETRQACVRYVNAITALCEPDQQENKTRFLNHYSGEQNKFGPDKPLDFRELFDGNDDNEFRLGVKLTRKTIKFYSMFYNSDIIFASPLGLRRAINGDESKKADYDFLSSIEILIVDQADAMLMQNWEHVEFAFRHLNLQPKESHGCDFSRVRQWYLDQNAKHLRQTIVFSAYLTPELNSLANTHMLNIAGRTKHTPTFDGDMLETGLQIRQTFYRFRAVSPMSEPDERFKFFTTAILPTLVRQAEADPDGQLGILIFIPSYLDFARVRNYLTSSQATQNISFGSISEYTESKEVNRTRSHLMSGKFSMVLYTGRAHHFRRNKIKGVKRVILYGLPENPLFYKELIGGFLGDSITGGALHPAEAHSKSIFSVWDGMSLERIVGTGRIQKMLNDKGSDNFEFR